MKTIKTILTAVSFFAILSAFSNNVNAQSTRSKIMAFMSSNGWIPDSLNLPLQPKQNEYGAKGFYNFKKDNKYTIVAYSENPEVKRVNLRVEYINGDQFKKDFNTHVIKHLFRLDYECAVLMFSDKKDLTLSVEPMTKKCAGKGCGSDVEYIIFYR